MFNMLTVSKRKRYLNFFYPCQLRGTCISASEANFIMYIWPTNLEVEMVISTKQHASRQKTKSCHQTVLGVSKKGNRYCKMLEIANVM